MHKYFFFILLILSAILPLQGQQAGEHNELNIKIIFQMVSGDTLDHKALVRQLNNILKLEPQAQLEVVCHGPGLNVIHKSHSIIYPQIKDLVQKGVDFAGCEFTMQQKHIPREALFDEIRTVPGGILEIVYKQNQGFAYIKSGY